MLLVTAEIKIPESELEFSYARSSGPGGQNVNKVNSKVVLRWNAFQNQTLPLAVRARFLSRFETRLTNDGAMIINSDRFRDQLRNREDCLAKLHALILEVLHPPAPRHKTRPTRSSKERRKNNKRRQGEKKKHRTRISNFD